MRGAVAIGSESPYDLHRAGSNLWRSLCHRAHNLLDFGLVRHVIENCCPTVGVAVHPIGYVICYPFGVSAGKSGKCRIPRTGITDQLMEDLKNGLAAGLGRCGHH